MYHRDLFADFFRDRLTCDELIGFIDQLPRRSRFGAALADDDELAELMADTAVAGTSIRFEEYSAEVQYLADAVDRLNTIVGIAVHMASQGKQHLELPPADRPQSAAERLQRRREEDYYSSLEEEIEQAHRRWLHENPDEEV